MSKHLSVLLLIGGIFFFSCSEENAEFGTELIGDISVQFELLDTLSISLETVRYDSLVTDNLSRFLIGSSTEQEGRPGELRSSAYFELGTLSEGIPDIRAQSATEPTEFIYDSLALVMIYQGYARGDSTQEVTYNLFRMTDDLETFEDDKTIYAFTNPGFDEENPLGSATVIPKPASRDTVTIRVSDDLGQTIFDSVSVFNGINGENLQKFFKGFVITSEQEHDFIAQFGVSNMRLIMYTHRDDTTELPRNVVFGINGNPTSSVRPLDRYFSGYHKDFSGTVVEQLTADKQSVATEQTDNLAYISTGRGLAVKISLPHVSQFLKDLDGDLVGSATLTLKAVFVPNAQPDALASGFSQLGMYALNEDNEAFRLYSDRANIFIDNEFNVGTRVEVDLTDYLQGLLAQDTTIANTTVLINPVTPLNESLVESFAVGGANNEDLKPSLSVTVIKRNEN